MVTAADLAKRLGAKRSGKGWTALCPAHQDHRPSLSILEGGKGGVVLKCHAGCSCEQILSALGMASEDLRPVKRNGNHAAELVAAYPLLR